jgi:hypothetical protein
MQRVSGKLDASDPDFGEWLPVTAQPLEAFAPLLVEHLDAGGVPVFDDLGGDASPVHGGGADVLICLVRHQQDLIELDRGTRLSGQPRHAHPVLGADGELFPTDLYNGVHPRLPLDDRFIDDNGN